MADVATPVKKQSRSKQTITITDLTSKYQQKVNNYNTMVSLMGDEQKKIFQVAINIYDIKQRQMHADSYIGYALAALLMNGWYYDVGANQWLKCQTIEEIDIQPTPDEVAHNVPLDEIKYGRYRRYIDTLYSRDACNALGISRWEIFDPIMDGLLDSNEVKQAVSGEMVYEEYGLNFTLEQYEMGGEAAKTKQQPNKITHPAIPISPNIDVNELTRGDTSTDKFLYAYTDSGISKNNRNWRPMIMDRIAQQVMEQNPPGNMGHMKPENVGYELPLPVVTWIGAMTTMLPDGNKRLWLKGYIIPTEDGNNLKTYIRAKAINSISVFGGLTLLPNQETGVQDVLDIDLKSIDISGKLKEGLNSGITELSGEMAMVSNSEPMQNMMLKDTLLNESEENVMGNTLDIKTITLGEIKNGNPQLYGEMQAEIIANMQADNEQKVILTKAGEMDTLTVQLGGNPMDVFKQYQAYAGEMAEAVGVTPIPNDTMGTIKAVADKVKEMAKSLTNVITILKPADNQTVEAKAEEVAQQNQLIANTKAVQDANTKFNELTAGIGNDAMKNLVAMQFSNILNAKPEALPEGYAASAISTLETQVPEAIKGVTENAQSLIQDGQTAGEMLVLGNLGVGAGASAQNKSYADMTDSEAAQALGYVF